MPLKSLSFHKIIQIVKTNLDVRHDAFNSIGNNDVLRGCNLQSILKVALINGTLSRYESKNLLFKCTKVIKCLHDFDLELSK